MHEAITLVLTHVRMVWRFRWLALVLASIVCVVGWTWVVMMPNVYRVDAKVFLDTSSMLRPLLRGLATPSGAIGAVNTVQRTLLVRPNLEAIARKTDLDLQAKTPEEFDQVLNSLRKRIRISGTARSQIFNIGFTDPKPEQATRVVEAILNLFVERSLGESRKDVGKTKQFIDQQIAEYEARLNAADDRVKEFKQRNVGQMPEQGGTYFSRYQSMQATLDQARLQLDEATRRRDEYQRQLDGVETLFETEIVAQTPESQGPHPLDRRISSLQQRLDQLTLQYTEKHPDVMSTRSMLADLEAEREATPVEQPVAAPAESLQVQNPVSAQLELALLQSQAEVAGLTARVVEYERRAEELKKMVDTIPRIEAELKRLNRDYSLTKRNYDELVKRREQLTMGEEASQSADNVQFNIIDPPRVPLNPTGPDRPMLSAVVLIAGLGAGAGFAWLFAMLRPALYSRDEVETALGLPVIGTVTRTWTRSEVLRRRMEVATFVVGCTVLVASFSALIVVELHSAELLDRVREVDVLQQVVRRVGKTRMNIIEKAVEKLEAEVEDLLREESAESTKGRPTNGQSVASSVAEASQEPLADQGVVHDQAATPTPASFSAPELPASVVHGDLRSEAVELDLEGLGAAGYVTPARDQGLMAEEFRIIKRPLVARATPGNSAHVHNGNLIILTSSLPAEGKTFNAVNLAMSIAMEVERTVLLVDADVAKSDVSRVLGIGARRGLSNYLDGSEKDLSKLIVRTNVDSLSLLPSGPRHARYTELLASAQMRALVQEMAERYSDRIVIFDSPPLLATSGASVLASLMGQVVMVVEAVRTPQSAVRESVRRLGALPCVSIVLNKQRRMRAGNYGYDPYGYGYGYGYGHGHDAERTPRPEAG